MYRAQVKMKKCLQSRWETKLNAMHKERLSNIRSRIDTKNPTQFSHILRKRKKEQMMEGNLLIENRSIH